MLKSKNELKPFKILKKFRSAVAFFFLFFLSRNYIWNTAPLLLVTCRRLAVVLMPPMCCYTFGLRGMINEIINLKYIKQ